mmetsp:Transcript_22656/g.43001  ORF Transcript_22656/g.43001 Transcript_22656/m.43001 type:complete len:221 (-) Transcript_22656:60-722(-)
MDANKRAREERVTINVGGTARVVAVGTIMNYPETMLGAMLSTRWEQSGVESKDIFIDRDPIRFRYILDFYRDGKITIPLTMSKAEMLREADYFALPVTVTDIEFDKSDIVSLRKAVTTFENTLVNSFQEEARKRSVVACAYEIAALLIQKMRLHPNDATVGLTKDELSLKSFASVLCPCVLDDPIFQETITGLVKQAGYGFSGEISSEHLVLSRAPLSAT